MRSLFSSGQWRATPRRRSHILLALLLVLIVIAAAACNNQTDNPNRDHKAPETTLRTGNNGRKTRASDSLNNWINWNILFTPKTDSAYRAQYMAVLRSNIIAYIRANTQFFRNNAPVPYDSNTNSLIRINYCTCDPLLYNIAVGLYTDPKIDTTGEIVTPTPSKPIGVHGGLVERISNNDALDQGNPQLQALRFPRLFDTTFLSGTTVPVDTSQILGIIDTGIDSTLFSPAVLRLSQGNDLVFNSLPEADPKDVSDNGSFSHGSIVIAQALRQYSGRYPRIMVIKAFDNKGSGSVFSASCGIKYAIDHHASLINASWGYYGDPDSVLLHYIAMTAQPTASARPILFIAAAGNDTTGTGNADTICLHEIKKANELKSGHHFFPACFSPLMNNMLVVTGLSRDIYGNFFPCYYQNYSRTFVSVGVQDSGQCCSYNIPFVSLPVTGTSFCAPVVSGKIGAFLLKNPAATAPPTAQGYLSLIGGQASSRDTFTIQGRFISSRQGNR